MRASRGAPVSALSDIPPAGAGLRARLGARLGTGLKARALRGAAVSVGAMGAAQILRFGINMVLARLLFPEAFGIMALVAVAMTALQMLSDAGLRASVVQSARGDDPAFLGTVWTLQAFRGALICGAVCLLAGPLAALWEVPELAAILPVAGLAAVIGGLAPTRVLVAQRHMALGRLARLDLTAQAAGGLVTIGLALTLGSVWALVLGNLVHAAALLALQAARLPGPRQPPRLERRAVGEVVSLGKWLFLSTIASFAINQGDRAVLGAAVEPGMLGLYSIAFALATLPLMMARRLSAQVVFPLYRMRHPLDGAANRRDLFRARRGAAAGALALSAGAAWAGPPLVGLLYDHRYAAAAPMVAMLAMAMVPAIVLQGMTHAALARGDSRSFMIVNVATAAAQTAVLLWAAPRFGIPGAALAMGLGPVLSYPVLARVLRRYANWDPAGDAALLLFGLAVTGAGLWAVWGGAPPV